MKKYDAIVVGGGIIGCAIAAELRKEKLRVAVIEKNSLPGQEAAVASAGMLAPHAGPRGRTTFFALLREALASYGDFVKEVEQTSGVDTEYRHTGLFYLAFDEEDEKALEQKKEWQNVSGVKAEWLSGDDVRKQEPQIGPALRRGLYFPEDWQIDNIKLTRAVHLWAEKLGVEFILAQAAVRFWQEREIARGVILGNETIESPIVINAAGAWADFDKNLPFKIPVKPSRGQILVFEHNPQVFKRMLYTTKVYVVPREDGRLIVGSTVESVGYDKNVTLKGLNKLVRGFLQINPELSHLVFKQAWAGLRPRSKDNLPILGKTPIQGLYIATGHFRNGILLAPMTGKIMSQLIQNKQTDHDISSFSIQRFFDVKANQACCAVE